MQFHKSIRIVLYESYNSYNELYNFDNYAHSNIPWPLKNFIVRIVAFAKEYDSDNSRVRSNNLLVDSIEDQHQRQDPNLLSPHQSLDLSLSFNRCEFQTLILSLASFVNPWQNSALIPSPLDLGVGSLDFEQLVWFLGFWVGDLAFAVFFPDLETKASYNI